MLRKKWATIINENQFSTLDFLPILNEKEQIASRFLWLLSEVGEMYPAILKADLPAWFQQFEKGQVALKHALPTYWKIVGVPLENEGTAIDLLFAVIASNEANVTIKSRAIFVLHNLVQKYPHLKGEFEVCLNAQRNKYSAAFDKGIRKILR
ncbi:hypothetical protein [Putridiphycobacter roseus]|nr:hypothetical protein [Putridiphycobacter roseus]